MASIPEDTVLWLAVVKESADTSYMIHKVFCINLRQVISYSSEVNVIHFDD
jgi:hypothetical protein